MSFYIRNISALVLSAVILSQLAACTGQESLKEDVAVLPPQPEKDGVVFNVLAGEFAGTHGSLSEAADYYMRAARESGDAQIADRAAHIALYARRYEDVLEAVDIWQKTEPREAEAGRVRGIAYLNLGQTEAAARAFEKFLFPEGKLNTQAMNVFATILLRHKGDKAALDVLNRLDKQHPGQAPLMLQLARYQARVKHYQQAMDTVNAVLKKQPDSSVAYLVKAQILSAQNREDEALAAVSKALEMRPSDNRLRLQYARMLVRLKKYDAAWEEFIQLRLNMPEDSGVLLSLALLSVETNKPILAREYFRELIKKGQHADQAHYYLGRIEQSEKNIEAALKHYQQVKQGDFALDARIRSAGLLAATGKLDQAMDVLRKLIAQDVDKTTKSRLYLAQGELLRKQQRIADAMELYTHALQQLPDDPDLLYARALTAEKLDRMDVTEADLLKVLKQEPENANALNALGFTLADRNERLQEAKKYILRAAQLLPDDPAVLDSLGWLYYRLGQYDEALKWLQKAFAEYKDAEIAAHLGEVLWKNGEPDRAREIWQQGIKLNSDNPVLQKTLKRYQP